MPLDYRKMIEHPPLKKIDMTIVGDLFALRFVADNQVELYSEDDENFFYKASFHCSWLKDLSQVAVDGMQRMLEQS